MIIEGGQVGDGHMFLVQNRVNRVEVEVVSKDPCRWSRRRRGNWNRDNDRVERHPSHTSHFSRVI